MSGERWTFESLLEHVLTVIEANDRRYEQRFKDSQTAVDAALNAARTAVDAALTSAKEAVQKAETASEKRFEGVNEFRETLADQQRTLMPRSEAELRMNALEIQLKQLNDQGIERRGRGTGAKDSWGLIVGAIGILIALLTIALRFMGQ